MGTSGRGSTKSRLQNQDLKNVTAGELEKDGHISDAMYEAMRRYIALMT